MQASDYKNKVLNTEAMHFCLNVVEFFESLPQEREFFKKASLDALTFCGSLKEVGLYLLSLKELALHHPIVEKEKFLSVAHRVGEGTQQLFAFLQTTKLLAEKEDFKSWDSFFNTAMIAAKDDAAMADYLTTVRHLAETPGFAAWPEFFTMVKRLKELPSGKECEVFSAVRHGIQYFVEVESIKGMFRVLAESPQYAGAFAYGQLDSKKWLIEEAQKAWDSSWGVVFVLAGWIGVLPRMIFDKKITVTKILSFDIDSAANHASEFLNQAEVQKDWLFKSSSLDITTMRYPTTFNVLRKDRSLCPLSESPNVVINTSCEHIKDLDLWFSQIPDGTRVILQSNDGFHIPEHVACFKSLEAFAKSVPLSRTDFAGEKALPEFNRFMLIGVK
jgi:hypothetical protein